MKQHTFKRACEIYDKIALGNGRHMVARLPGDKFLLSVVRETSRLFKSTGYARVIGVYDQAIHFKHFIEDIEHAINDYKDSKVGEK